jgi:hypothetical protein
MNGDPSWKARHDGLRSRLQETGTILGDKQAPVERREEAAKQFVEVWTEFCRNLRDNPELSIPTRPR